MNQDKHENKPPTWSRASSLREYILPILAAGLPLAAAVIGALITNSVNVEPIEQIEKLSSASSRLLANFSSFIPLGIAFSAGMVATVNPCGFPMLPTYLAIYIGSDDGSTSQSTKLKRTAKALIVGLAVTTGFLIMFGTAGLLIGSGAQFLIRAIPWIGLSVGLFLSLTGAWMLRGGKLYSGLAQRAASHIGGTPNSVSAKGYILYGIAYATASLSCTLPIFMAVTGISLTSPSSIDTVIQFFAYGLGMGTVIIILTLGIALFKNTLLVKIRSIQPYILPVGTVFMILTGAYLVFYWLTVGGILRKSI